AAVAALVIVFAIVQFSGRQGQESTFAVYARQMAGIALRGYVMDRTTDSPAKIRAYLSSQGAPADFHLPPGLAKAQLVGCAVETWGGAKVSMICFRTGQALPPGQASDLWLFVAKAGALKNAPTDATPEFSRINRLALASWSQNGDVYLMGIEADHKALQSFL
ncbi:MAG TPA: hypothetical protein VHH88_04625, partial [Verrucomicrobiae bacterium]|nr:hypothetical protein [Verrucomicrobiae bacterium]